MKCRLFGILCQLAGAAAALAGLILAGVIVNPWRNTQAVDQAQEAYAAANIIKSALCAFAGLALGYLLFRTGRHLRAKYALESTSTSDRKTSP